MPQFTSPFQPLGQWLSTHRPPDRGGSCTQTISVSPPSNRPCRCPFSMAPFSAREGSQVLCVLSLAFSSLKNSYRGPSETHMPPPHARMAGSCHRALARPTHHPQHARVAGSCHSGPGTGQEQAEGTEAATCANADHCSYHSRHGVGSLHPGFSGFPKKISVPNRAAGGESWWDQGPGGTVVQAWVLSVAYCPSRGVQVRAPWCRVCVWSELLEGGVAFSRPQGLPQVWWYLILFIPFLLVPWGPYFLQESPGG